MKINETEYIKEVTKIYNGEIQIIGKFKGLAFPILAKDKYGVLSISKASLLLHYKPTIKAALNQTEYFMSMLTEKHPEIAKLVRPASEYKAAKQKMLFETKFGLVSVNPDSLLAGHEPTVRVAINRKDYMYKQLKYLYGDKYEFIIHSTDRHKGKCELICPIHGHVFVDNDYIFSGVGCIECNSHMNKSDVLYIVKLSSEEESFYKLGITYRKRNGKLQRYSQYAQFGYKIEEIKTISFESFEECRDKETELKRLIKNNLYLPKKWPNKISTETFTGDLLEIVIKNL